MGGGGEETLLPLGQRFLAHEMEILVRSEVYRSNVVEVDVRCRYGQFEASWKISLPQALEYPMVTLGTFEIEPKRPLFSLFFTRDSIAASKSGALENVGGVTTLPTMCS